jgi:hypothetical protein
MDSSAEQIWKTSCNSLLHPFHVDVVVKRSAKIVVHSSVEILAIPKKIGGGSSAWHSYTPVRCHSPCDGPYIAGDIASPAVLQ